MYALTLCEQNEKLNITRPKWKSNRWSSNKTNSPHAISTAAQQIGHDWTLAGLILKIQSLRASVEVKLKYYYVTLKHLVTFEWILYTMC